MSRTLKLAVALVLATAFGNVAAPAGAATNTASTVAGVEQITFGDYTCAPGWWLTSPGRNRFTVVNQSSRTATVYLFRADSGAITKTVAGLKPGRKRTITVKLTGGDPYAWGCDLNGYPRHVSDPIVVPLNPPLTAQSFAGPIRAFRRYTTGRLDAASAVVAAMRRAIATGSVGLARADWIEAHDDYLQIGEDDQAYGIFGDLGRSIDGTAAGRPGGIGNSNFTGFHRVEVDLWWRSDRGRAAADAATLARLLGQARSQSLVKLLPITAASAASWSIRGHEIFEDALRDTLDGDDDYGSHSELYALTADLAATRKVLALEAPLIRPRDRGLLPAVEAELNQLAAALRSGLHARVRLSIAQLPTLERETIDARVDGALETLSALPGVLQIGGQIAT